MHRTIFRVKLAFLALFVLAAAGLWAHQIFYITPKRECEEAGLWWAAKWRVCTAPIEISTLTGRPGPDEAAPAAETP